MDRKKILKQHSDITEQIMGVIQENSTLGVRVNNCDENILSLETEFAKIYSEIELIILDVDEGRAPRDALIKLHKRRNSIGDDLTEKRALRRALLAKQTKNNDQVEACKIEKAKIEKILKIYEIEDVIIRINAETPKIQALLNDYWSVIDKYRPHTQLIELNTVTIPRKIDTIPNHKNFIFYRPLLENQKQ